MLANALQIPMREWSQHDQTAVVVNEHTVKCNVLSDLWALSLCPLSMVPARLYASTHSMSCLPEGQALHADVRVLQCLTVFDLLLEHLKGCWRDAPGLYTHTLTLQCMAAFICPAVPTQICATPCEACDYKALEKQTLSVGKHIPVPSPPLQVRLKA